jgi:hypothetical protein
MRQDLEEEVGEVDTPREDLPVRVNRKMNSVERRHEAHLRDRDFDSLTGGGMFRRALVPGDLFQHAQKLADQDSHVPDRCDYLIA